MRALAHDKGHPLTAEINLYLPNLQDPPICGRLLALGGMWVYPGGIV